LKDSVKLRSLLPTDLSEILIIERDCFPDPWPAAWFREAIRAHDPCYGAFNGEKLIGYLIACFEEECIHLANLAVDYDYRGIGIGKTLVLHLLQFAKTNGSKRTYLEVRESNNVAIRLYESCGFFKAGREKNYYQGLEDALIFSLELNDGLV
jgi:[ribosomal protein S18]-alanine N-acetyltransferase